MDEQREKKQKPLSATQADLLAVMETGTGCHFMPYMGTFNPSSYYYRADTHKRCTAAANALLAKGLVRVVNKDYRGHTLVAIKSATP